jgi:hypothetical protein
MNINLVPAEVYSGMTRFVTRLDLSRAERRTNKMLGLSLCECLFSVT